MRNYCLPFILLLLGFCLPVFSQEKYALVNSGDVLAQGVKLYDDGKFKEAITLYKTVSRSDTNYADILYELAYTSYTDSNYAESEQYSKEGLKLFPEKATQWYMLIGNAADAAEKREEAITWYDKALQLNPYDYYCWFNKGIALYNADRPDDAMECFKKAVLIYPYHASSHYFMGVICTDKGQLPQAMLCFTTNLLMNPENRYAKKVVSYMSDIAKMTDEVSKNAASAKESNTDDFAMQQEIIISKAALDTRYKLLTDLEDPITRQLQVLLEKLEYNAADKGFWMQYYVPFYARIFKEDKYNTLVNYIFSGLDIKSAQTYIKRNEKEVDVVINDATTYFSLINETEKLQLSERASASPRFYFSNKKLLGIGMWREEEKDNIFYGPWKFFYESGQMKSRGSFNTAGEKEGEWEFYYENGRKKEKSTFVNGMANGKSVFWFSNGNMSEEDIYKNDLLDGEARTYFYNGMPKAVMQYKDDKKNGSYVSYTSSGYHEVSSFYKDDEIDGKAVIYFNNGKPSYRKNFKAGLLDGIYQGFNEDGLLVLDGVYTEDKQTGVWKSYYDNKQLSSSYSYTGGKLSGEYLEYYENGKLQQRTPYSEGKQDGKEEIYDEDGIKYCESIYENARLREINFFDKKGDLVSTSTTRKGAGNLEFYDPYGNKITDGYFNKDGYRDGKSLYYFRNGKVKTESFFKEGLLQNERTIFYADGSVAEKVNFTDDKEDGFLTAWHQNGKPSYTGWYVNGEKQGEHKTFNVLGTLVKSAYFLNDIENGYTVYYHANGKKDYEQLFTSGWLSHITQFDTTGNIISETDFPAGEGTLVLKNYNGSPYVQVAYKAYNMHGKYQAFYYDGSTNMETWYRNGDKDSIERRYYYGGQLASEGRYVRGAREGLWKYYHPSGKTDYTQNYRNGNAEGKQMMYNEDGSKDKEISYKNDQLEGETIIYGGKNEVAVILYYHENKIIAYTFEGKDGKLLPVIPLKNGSGLVTAYYKNGTKSAEINFMEDEINGVRNLWYSNGKPYIQGKRISGYDDGIKKIFYENGNVEKEENYLYGNYHGTIKNYYPDGKLKMEENWHNGDQHGISKYYDEKGNLQYTMMYYFNILQSVKK